MEYFEKSNHWTRERGSAEHTEVSKGHSSWETSLNNDFSPSDIHVTVCHPLKDAICKILLSYRMRRHTSLALTRCSSAWSYRKIRLRHTSEISALQKLVSGRTKKPSTAILGWHCLTKKMELQNNQVSLMSESHTTLLACWDTPKNKLQKLKQ